MTESGSLLLEQKQTFVINDVLTIAETNAGYATALNDIYGIVQSEVDARGLYAPSTPDSGSADSSNNV